MRKNLQIENRKLTPYLFLLPALIILCLTVFWSAIQAFSLIFRDCNVDQKLKFF